MTTCVLLAAVKLIAGGWDVGALTPQQAIDQVDLLENSPFDGIGLAFKHVKMTDGKDHNLSWGAMSEPVTDADLEQFVAPLSKFKDHRCLRDSSIGLCWVPILRSRLPWDDDAAWKRFADNMGAFARLLRKTGLNILSLDTEDYSGSLQYTQIASDPPYAKTAKLARQRGREIGNAIFKEHPTIVLEFMWLLSMDRQLTLGADPASLLRAKGDLWYPFVDGLLDALPPDARLIEGDEHGYGFKAELREYEAAVARHAVAESKLLSPENRGKYRAQTIFGFGLYLDGYLLKEGEAYFNETGAGDSKFGTLVKRVRDAFRAGDGYVWLWGEHHCFAPWRKMTPAFGFMKIEKTTWDDMYPGFSEVMAGLKDPVGALRKTLDGAVADGKTPNLAAKALEKINDTWQHKRHAKGTFASEKGAGKDGSVRVVAKGVGYGTVQLSCGSAKPGERFVAQAYVDKAERVYAALRWRDKSGWFRSMQFDAEGAPGPAEADGTHRIMVEGRVPEGASGVTLQLAVRLGENETANFDRIFACRLPEIR